MLALASLGVFSVATPVLQAEVARQVIESASVDVAEAGLNARGIELDSKTKQRRHTDWPTGRSRIAKR